MLRSYILMYLYTKFWITWFAYPSSYDLTGFIVSTSSYSSYISCLSNWHTCITRSIILSPPSLALSLKIFPISRLSIRGIVFSCLTCHYPSLTPPSIAFICYTILITLILSINEVIPSCFCYIKKGLVCVAITALSSR